jgi:hypothetical protein
MYNELRYQAKTHAIFEKLYIKKKKKQQKKKDNKKNNKNLLDENECKNTPNMCGKIKPDLKERDLDIPR